mgnify:CR=1 FL=1
MSHTKSFQIGSLCVNAAMASALEQDEVMSLISAEVINRAYMAARTENASMGEQILTNMFFSMPSQVKQRVAGVLLSRVFVAGTQQKVTVNDFAGKMVDYNTLLSQLTLWNFDDFFTYLSDAVKDVVPAHQNEKAQ